MPQQYIQHNTPAYAEPVLRGSSPTSSSSTIQGDPPPSFEDELSPAEFHRRMEQEIGLGRLSDREKAANESPLIRVPEHYYDPHTGEAEREQIERDMYRNVMINLRQLVSRLEEEQRFQATMKKSVLRPVEQTPVADSDNLSALLQSMMKRDVASTSTPISTQPRE